MPEQPSTPVLGQIRSLCAQLADRHGLDDDAREEMCGHLEDKLVGYLSGEVRVSEQDALLLVRAHFGDADRIAGSLGGQSRSARLDLPWRRRAVAKIAVATVVLMLGVVPACALGLGVGPRTAITIFGSLAVFEAGVFLATRADLHSLWQRGVAALLLLPTIAMLGLMLAEGIRELSRQASTQYPCVEFALSTTAALCLLGHVSLLALLLLPRRAHWGPPNMALSI